MTVDIDKLRALLAERDDAIANYDRSSPLSKGVLEDVRAELAAEAVNALPQLLAIAEAAEKWRDWTAPIEWDPHEQALIDAVDGKKGTMSQPDLYWHCVSCGGHEPAQTPYVLGDSEPCIACENGVARVMTTKEAAAAEQQVALGNAARKERT